MNTAVSAPFTGGFTYVNYGGSDRLSIFTMALPPSSSTKFWFKVSELEDIALVSGTSPALDSVHSHTNGESRLTIGYFPQAKAQELAVHVRKQHFMFAPLEPHYSDYSKLLKPTPRW